MLFYRIDGNLLNWPEGDERIVSAALQLKTDSYFRERKNGSYAFLVKGSTGCFTAGLITKENIAPAELAEEYLRRTELSCEDVSITEITIKEMTMLLRSADRRDFISDDDEVLFSLGIRGICRQYGLHFTENMLCSDEFSKKSLISDTEKLMWDQTLGPEIERIYTGAKITSATGHPVHYIVSCDDTEKRGQVSDILLSALHRNGRISSGRVCSLRSFDDIDVVSDLYRNCAGGTIIIDCRDEDGHDNAYNRRNVGEMTELCALANKYRNSVLTVFWLPASDNRMKNVIMECMGSTPMVELNENAITVPAARAYLRRCAKEHGIPVNKALYSVTEEGTALTTAVLDRCFSEWLSDRLRTSVYPQYASVRTACTQAKAAAESSDALSELNGMIGLEEAKKVINRALSYYKAQRMFAEKGITSGKPAMHMVFTGNPGTAKTTVARLFAQIMKEHNLLTSGELVEVGRADLVGKYVGWTAKIVKSCFHKAKGGVLFIDEAYSLVDDKEGLYGDEAINTIVQEMENNREDVIVIFAGYPDKMENFLQRNPGLRSRIAFHVPFSDYTSEELCSISAHIAEKKGLSLSEGARERLLSVFEAAVLTDDFGNGRFARNIIEQAQMEQAVRLVNMDYDSVTRKDVSTLHAEDIVVTQPAEKPRMCIGF